LPVDGAGDRLPYLELVQRWPLAVEEEREVAQLRRSFDREVVADLIDHRWITKDAELELIGSHAGQDRRLLGYDPDLHPVDGRRTIPVVRVRGQRQRLALPPVVEHERAGPVGFVRDGAGLDRGRRHDRGVRGREGRRQGRVRLGELQRDGLRVRRLDRLDRQQVRPDDRAGRLVEDALDRGLYVGGVERVAVVEGHALAQGHGERQAVVAVLPALGQTRLDDQVGVELEQRVVDELERLDGLERRGQLWIKVVDVARSRDHDGATLGRSARAAGIVVVLVLRGGRGAGRAEQGEGEQPRDREPTAHRHRHLPRSCELD
jgi:hypothetical protein